MLRHLVLVQSIKNALKLGQFNLVENIAPYQQYMWTNHLNWALE